MNRYGLLDGITLYDKVIQYRNRPQSNPIWAYNFNAKRAENVEVFNGEIGFVQKHSFDKKPGGRLRRFQVKFERKDHLAVGYGNELSSNGRFESVEDNLELAYAISVHKAQGSEFNHSYVVVPRSKGRSLSSELLYTALTRARQHCTLLVQGDVSTLLSARRPENAQTGLINSSLFDGFFRAVPDELINRKGWYEEGRIHEALSGDMVRSKSELVIANLLHEHDVPFAYEVLLRAPDGTMYLPGLHDRLAGRDLVLGALGDDVFRFLPRAPGPKDRLVRQELSGTPDRDLRRSAAKPGRRRQHISALCGLNVPDTPATSIMSYSGVRPIRQRA